MKGFTLIEILVYIGISSLIIISIMPFSLNIEKQLVLIHERSIETETADLIFKTYKSNSQEGSESEFICTKDEVKISYKGKEPQSIGEIEARDCTTQVIDATPDVPRHVEMTFSIGSKNYSENFY